MKSLFFSLCLASAALAAKLSKVWTLLTIDSTGGERPQDLHTANLGWLISTQGASQGDTFDLIMPGVFRTKFGSQQLRLVADDVTYALCDAWDGSYVTQYTSLLCTVTSAANTDRDITVTGVASFEFVFGAGGSTRNSDLYEASLFHSGENKIVWGGLSTTVTFTGGPFFSEGDESGLIYYSRSTPQCNEQLQVLSGSCEDGITLGFTMVTFEDDYDCSDFSIAMTKHLNDFHLPESYETVPELEVICQARRIIGKFSNVPGGYRVFLQGLYKYPAASETVFHHFGGNVTCGSGHTKTNNYAREIKVISGDADSSGNSREVVVTTTTWAETYTTVTTLPYESTASTITILVDVPDTHRATTTTTVTLEWTGAVTTTRTLPFDNEGPTVTVTVEVEEPAVNSSMSLVSSSGSSSRDHSVISVSSGESSESRSIVSRSSTLSYSQSSFVHSVSASTSDFSTTTHTTTSDWSNPYASTSTLPITSGATEVTVVIEVPTGAWSNSTVSSATSEIALTTSECHECQPTVTSTRCDVCVKSLSMAETSETAVTSAPQSEILPLAVTSTSITTGETHGVPETTVPVPETASPAPQISAFDTTTPSVTGTSVPSVPYVPNVPATDVPKVPETSEGAPTEVPVPTLEHDIDVPTSAVQPEEDTQSSATETAPASDDFPSTPDFTFDYTDDLGADTDRGTAATATEVPVIANETASLLTTGTSPVSVYTGSAIRVVPSFLVILLSILV